MCRLVLFLFLASVAFAQNTQTVRIVNAGNGWYFGKRALTRGDSVDANARLLGTQAAGEIVLECKQGWIAYSCKSGSCEISACVDKGLDQSRVKVDSAGFMARLEPYFRRQPKEPVIAVARNVGDPADSVLQITPMGVHFGPTLNRVLEGRYCFILTELPGGSAAAPMPRVLTVNWDRDVDPEGISPVPGISPGAYTLVKGTPGANGACGVDRNSTAAWIVMAPQTQFARVNGQWQENAARLDRLERNGASATFVTTLRHAMIAQLADGLAANR